MRFRRDDGRIEQAKADSGTRDRGREEAKWVWRNEVWNEEKMERAIKMENQRGKEKRGGCWAGKKI